MNHRTGTTLIEVLVAIFVMGIGLLSILVLFPLGALSMAQAIRDDRSAHSIANARAVAEARDIRNDPAVVSALDNPDTSGAFLDLSAQVSYDGPSYPVFVDPFGVYSSLGNASLWVTGAFTGPAGANPYGVARRSLDFLNNAGAQQNYFAMLWFTLPDDIQFTTDGQPNGSLNSANPGEIERESAYSWAYLLRRPRRSIASAVDMSIVVYNRRPLRLTQGVNPNEYAYNATFKSANTVTLSWAAGSSPPDLRPGAWILDATIEANKDGSVKKPHGFFYRVRDINNVTATTMDLLIDGSFREFSTTAYNPVFVVLDGVVEVAEVRSDWQP
jgi:type II secretory pathway pseudopilin PulG